jgi:hypothetical protein
LRGHLLSCTPSLQRGPTRRHFHKASGGCGKLASTILAVLVDVAKGRIRF